MNPRSCLRWQPTGRILKTVCLRWVPTGKLLNSCMGKVENEPTHGSNVDIPHIHACKQTLGLSAGTSFNGQKQQRIDITADALYNEKQENLRVWLLKFLISKKPVPEWPRSSMFKRRLIAADQALVFMAMTSVHISSGLVLHQMTSDHNRSELGIQDHSNEQSSSKLVPKVVPLAVKTATSRQELELTIDPPSHSMQSDNSHKVVRLGINPMIQPEPEDLPKDNPKLEIAVLRWQSAQASEYYCTNRSLEPKVILFSIHNDEWKSFQCHHQTALRSVINELTSGEIVSLNFIESIKEARSRVQDLTSGEIVSLNFIESIKEARSRVQDLTSGEICLRFMGKRTNVNAMSRGSTKVDESKLCDIPVYKEQHQLRSPVSFSAYRDERVVGIIARAARIWILMVGDERTLIMEEAYATKYSVHPRVIEDEHQRSSGLLLQPEIPDFARHGVHVSSISDKDGMYIETDGQSERTFQTLENMFRACVRNLVVVGILTFREVSFPTKMVIIRVFDVFSLEALYIRRVLRKPKIVKRVKLIVEMKLLGFSVGDHVMMKVSHWKSVVRFNKKDELAPRCIEPIEIPESISPVAYRLRLPDELSIGSYLSGVKISSKPEIALIFVKRR
ncbi:hypothetical protein Tco_0173552 [Tanacetum coccineum]